jgi:hypothetical protein
LKEKKEESGKYNPSREQVEYEIGQNTTTMKNSNKKIRHCSNKCMTKIVKLMCL